MAVKSLSFGESLSGLLVDGVDGTPYLGCNLRMDESAGVIVEIPFIHGDQTKQFASVEEWFSTRTPPENLLLKTADGDISLYGVGWFKHTKKSGGGVDTGQLRPAETVLARRKADLAEPLLVSELRSRVDGLEEWSGFTTLRQRTNTDQNGLVKKLIVEVESIQSVEWAQDKSTMTLHGDWRANPSTEIDTPNLAVFDSVVLDSKFAESRPLIDHLAEQRKVVHLLVLLFDGEIHFRHHRVKDKTFAIDYGDGVDRPFFVELISRNTVRDYARPKFAKSNRRRPLVYLQQIGPQSLARWAEQHERWKRFILPTVGILMMGDALVEDLVVSLSMSIEAGGHLVGKRDGEGVTYCRSNPTTATYVYRCLHSVGANWGERVESMAGLARAAADIYNAIKHFDRGELPDPEKTHLISLVLRQTVQFMTLNILDPSGKLLEETKVREGALRIHGAFAACEVQISDDGTWKHAPAPVFEPLPDGMSFG